jgi:hypothetical protein
MPYINEGERIPIEPVEPINTGRFGPGNPGRPKGVPNKATTAAKDAIAAAAEGLGGTERLVAWARADPQNERVFWGTIYPKLLPLTVGGTGSTGEILFGWLGQ